PNIWFKSSIVDIKWVVGGKNFFVIGLGAGTSEISIVWIRASVSFDSEGLAGLVLGALAELIFDALAHGMCLDKVNPWFL
ncbi:hypothetical protein, partial [Idiomarina sp. ST10R2A5]|uniref:hypothetical protein n=1 Tax=Idiomarina sp. ST10R2A5 TaxID=3418368 RepID=UPI003EC79EE8